MERRRVLRQGIHSKRVDWIEHRFEKSAAALTERVELLDVRHGNETVRKKAFDVDFDLRGYDWGKIRP